MLQKLTFDNYDFHAKLPNESAPNYRKQVFIA